MSKRHIWIKLCWSQLWGPTERSFSLRDNWKNRAKTRQRDPTKGKCCIWMHMECTLRHTHRSTVCWLRKSEPRKLFLTPYQRSFPTSSCLKSLGVERQWHYSDIRGISAHRHMSGACMIGCWTSQTMQNAAVCFDRGFQNRCCNLCSRGSCFKCVKPTWLASVVESQGAPFWKCRSCLKPPHWFLASQLQQGREHHQDAEGASQANSQLTFHDWVSNVGSRYICPWYCEPNGKEPLFFEVGWTHPHEARLWPLKGVEEVCWTWSYLDCLPTRTMCMPFGDILRGNSWTPSGKQKRQQTFHKMSHVYFTGFTTRTFPLGAPLPTEHSKKYNNGLVVA